MQEGQDGFRDPTSIAMWKPIPMLGSVLLSSQGADPMVLGTSDVPMLIRPFLIAGLDRVLREVTVPDHTRGQG